MKIENEDEKRLGDACLRSLFVAACVMVGMAAICLLCGCSTTKYVPTENIVVKTDTMYSVKVRVDTIQVHDSVAVVQKGDTIMITKYRDRFKIRERIDTLYKTSVDSVEVKVPYPVERELTTWEQAKMGLGGLAMGGLGIIVVAICGLLLWRKFKE